MTAENVVSIGYPLTEMNPDRLPLPTQELFHNSIAKYRLLAGGFATGKTTTLCIETLKELMKYEKNYGVLGRKDLQELKSTTLKEFFDICPPELIKDHNKQDRVVKMANDSELYYMNLDDSREATEKIKSLNLGFVAIDQLEEIQEAVFLAFVGRLRRYNSSRNFFATCNPAGHDWLWEKWKNAPPSEEYKLFEAITLENRYLPKDYVKELLNYPDKWVKRFVYCSWEDFEGLVYNEYIEKFNKCPVYEPNDSDSIHIVMDYGYRNPTSVGFWAVDYDGIARRYAEIYKSGMRISDLAGEIKSFKNWDKAVLIADPSIWGTQRDGRSVGDEFRDNDLFFLRADNNVSQGIERVNQKLKDKTLLICENCENWFREQGKYKWKEIKPGQDRNEYEEPVKKDDHSMDETRYFVNHIWTPSLPTIEPIHSGRWEAVNSEEKMSFAKY